LVQFAPSSPPHIPLPFIRVCGATRSKGSRAPSSLRAATVTGRSRSTAEIFIEHLSITTINARESIGTCAFLSPCLVTRQVVRESIDVRAYYTIVYHAVGVPGVRALVKAFEFFTKTSAVRFKRREYRMQVIS